MLKDGKEVMRLTGSLYRSVYALACLAAWAGMDTCASQHSNFGRYQCVCGGTHLEQAHGHIAQVQG